jgi:hypothetical protein
VIDGGRQWEREMDGERERERARDGERETDRCGGFDGCSVAVCVTRAGVNVMRTLVAHWSFLLFVALKNTLY